MATSLSEQCRQNPEFARALKVAAKKAFEKYGSVQFEAGMADGRITPEDIKMIGDISYEEALRLKDATKMIHAKANEWLYNKAENSPMLVALRDEPLFAKQIDKTLIVPMSQKTVQAGHIIAKNAARIRNLPKVQSELIKEIISDPEKLETPDSQIISGVVNGLTNVDLPPQVYEAAKEYVKKNIKHIINK